MQIPCPDEAFLGGGMRVNDHSIRMIVDRSLQAYKARHDLEHPSRPSVQIGSGSAMSLMFGVMGEYMLRPLLERIDELEQKTRRL